MVAAALTAAVGLGAVGLVLAGRGPGFTAQVLGVADSPSAPPITVAPLPTPELPVPAVPTPAPLATPPPSAPPGWIDPARVAELQASAWQALDDLDAFASYGNVDGAQALLGGTAPHLRASGLERATFPIVQPADIEIAGTDGAWTATAGTATLTSSDGVSWSFDYGERPLAAYARTSEYDLYVIPYATPRTIHVRITSLIVTRSFVRVSLAWQFDTDLDATAFDGKELRIVSITLGDRLYAVPDGPSVTIGGSSFEASLTVPVSVVPMARGTIEVGVYRAAGSKPIVSSDLKLKLL